MLVATYVDSNENPVIHNRVKGQHRWLIELYAFNDEERIKKTIRNKQSTLLSDLIEFAQKELLSMKVDLPDAHTAGFTVHLLR